MYVGYDIHWDTGFTLTPDHFKFASYGPAVENIKKEQSLLPLWSIGVFQGDLSPLSCHSVLKTCVFLLYESENWILTDGLMAKL